MNLLRSRVGLNRQQHAFHAGAETTAVALRNVIHVKPESTASAGWCLQQQQHRDQQLLAQPAPLHIRAISLACACLIAMDSGLPLAALADVPQQQQRQAEKHGLLGRLRQLVGPAGDGECMACCLCSKVADFTYRVHA